MATGGEQDIKNNMEINDKDAVAADASTSITGLPVQQVPVKVQRSFLGIKYGSAVKVANAEQTVSAKEMLQRYRAFGETSAQLIQLQKKANDEFQKIREGGGGVFEWDDDAQDAIEIIIKNSRKGKKIPLDYFVKNFPFNNELFPYDVLKLDSKILPSFIMVLQNLPRFPNAATTKLTKSKRLSVIPESHKSAVEEAKKVAKTKMKVFQYDFAEILSMLATKVEL